MSETPGPNPEELRSSQGGEDFRSIGQIPAEERDQYAADLGIDRENIDDMIKTRNNSTGQLISHGAEVVDKGNGDFALRPTAAQIDRIYAQGEKEYKQGRTSQASEAIGVSAEDHKEEEAMDKPSERSAEDIQRVTDTRNETMDTLRDGGAQEIRRTFTDGSDHLVFTPSADQVDAMHQEMVESKNRAEIEELARQREEIREDAEAVAEALENKNLSVQEMMNLLRNDIQKLTEAVDKLSRIRAEMEDAATEADGSTEDLGTTEDGERIDETMLPTVDDFPQEVIDRLPREEGPETVAENPEGTETATETQTAFENAQDNYLRLLAGSRRFFLGRPTEAQVSEARALYERARVDEALSRAEEIVSRDYPELQGAEREAMISKQVTAESMFQEIIRREAEDEIQNRSFPRRAFNWIKQHPRLRMFAGLALTGGAIIFGATGNVPGAAACIVGRSALAGLGTGMMVEGGLDRLQTGLDHKLRQLTPEQIADMTPEQLREAYAGMNAYEVRRGQDVNRGRFSESITAILAAQEADVRRTMERYIGEGMTPDMARGRALTEFVNGNNIAREGSDLDERSKSMVRGIAGVVTGIAVAGLSAYMGLSRLNPEPSPVPKPPDTTPSPTPTPPEVAPTPPPVTEFSVGASSEWEGIEQAMGSFTAKNGVQLTPKQWNIAVDYIKDEMNNFNPDSRNWVSPGWTARFTDTGWFSDFGGGAVEGGRGLRDAIEYALTHPNG